MIDQGYDWWRNMLYEIEDTTENQQLIERINLELQTNYPSSILQK